MGGSGPHKANCDRSRQTLQQGKQGYCIAQRSGLVSRDAQESIKMQASKPGVKSKQDIWDSRWQDTTLSATTILFQKQRQKGGGKGRNSVSHKPKTLPTYGKEYDGRRW